MKALSERGQERGNLILALWLIVLLLILGSAYLTTLVSERRFSGVQERNLQAWYLALSGREFLDYYATPHSLEPLLEAPGNLCQEAQPLPGGGVLWAKVPVPLDSEEYYFEISKLPSGLLAVRGVVEGTLSSAGEEAVRLERRLYFKDNGAGGWDYALYGEVEGP